MFISGDRPKAFFDSFSIQLSFWAENAFLSCVEIYENILFVEVFGSYYFFYLHSVGVSRWRGQRQFIDR